MVRVINEDHFLNVVKKVIELDKEHEFKFGLLSKLIDGLKYLDSFCDHNGDGRAIAELHHDSSPLSFYVSMKRDGKQFMNGGFLFHSGTGFNDGSFAVELDPPTGPHWSLHT